jgi:hypothetical protein
VVGQIAAMLDREARAGALAIDRPEFAAEPPISRSESHLGFVDDEEVSQGILPHHPQLSRIGIARS